MKKQYKNLLRICCIKMDTNTDIVVDGPKPVLSKQLLEVQKLKDLIETQTDQMDVLKTSLKTLMNSNNVLLKQVKKIEARVTKSSMKSKANRKPHGFARPTEVSEDLCVFMGKEKGSLVSRTEVTKSLIKYIADNKLQNPENKRQILPDETLLKLFGDDARNTVIDYFTMQKYVNHHFPKKQSS
jgi:chromatin remodeling complex protein RSC6